MINVLVVMAVVVAVIALVDLAAVKLGVDSRSFSTDTRAPRGGLSL